MSDINLQDLQALAKLSLTQEEQKAFPEQMESILSYVDQLKEVDVSDQHVHRQALQESDLREDVAQETTPEVRERLFANMPRSESGYLEVPEVFVE